MYRDNGYEAIIVSNLGDVAELLQNGLVPLFTLYGDFKRLESEAKGRITSWAKERVKGQVPDSGQLMLLAK